MAYMVTINLHASLKGALNEGQYVWSMILFGLKVGQLSDSQVQLSTFFKVCIIIFFYLFF